MSFAAQLTYNGSELVHKEVKYFCDEVIKFLKAKCSACPGKGAASMCSYDVFTKAREQYKYGHGKRSLRDNAGFR